MTKGSILTMVVLVAAVALVAPAASAQTTLNIQNGTVVGVWDNTLVIRDSSGVSRQFDVPPDFKVDVDGKTVSVKELRPGMHITAAVKTVNTPVVVQSKELRDATYLKHAGALVYVKEADGIHSYTTPAGFRFWINNAPLRPDDLQTNMKLNATIVHTGTATGTSQELAGASATDEAAKAAAAKAAADKAAADRAAKAADELLIALEEARAAIGHALRALAILLPQQRQRDALALELPMHPGKVRRGKVRIEVALRMQPREQRRVIQ